jgi:serine/threonine protein kinase
LTFILEFRHTFCGSPLYASPEIVSGIPYYGPEVDCWSLGVLLYTLVFGSMPFQGGDYNRLVRNITSGEFIQPRESSGKTSSRKFVREVCFHLTERDEKFEINEEIDR